MIISIICYARTLTGYSILFLTISILLGLFSGYQYFQSRNPKSAYENEVKKILNTYDSILLKFIPNDRIQYTNSLIYYYVEFLDKNKEQLNNNEKNKYNNNNDNDSDDSEIINPLIDNDNDNDNIEDEKKQHKKKMLIIVL